MEEEGVVQPPPVVVVADEEEVVQPPPLADEEAVVQPPPLVVEEVGVVLQPPPVVEEEEGVQPPLLGDEEEEGVQELPAPDPYAVLQAQWVTAALGYAEDCRHDVAIGVDYVISRCEAARVTLLEIAAVLLQEPIDAAETIYTDLLEDVSRGMNPLLIGPAANIVDSLFNWPGPLAGATVAVLVEQDVLHVTGQDPPPP